MARSLSPERKNAFLDAALKLFAEKGVQHTSTAEIAQAAGSAVGTLFLYFATKQSLVDALILKISREQSEAINALLTTSQSAREMFFQIWQGSIHWFLNNPEAYRFTQQSREPGLISEEVVRESEQFLVYYYQAIQKGLAEGSLSAYPPEVIGTFLYQDMIAVMSLVEHEDDAVKRDTLIQTGFRIFWNGIKA